VVVVTAHFSRFALVALMLSAALPAAAQNQTAQAQSARELRASLDAAKSQAAETVGLDAAYELVGIAEAAQNSGLAELGKEAVGTLNMVLNRAAQAALSVPVEDAQDTLDQLVDLAFFTRNSNISGAEAVLQKSLRALFTKLLGDVRLALAGANTTPEAWVKALTSLGVLGELQAAATLMMQEDLSSSIAGVYDAEAARLDGLGRQIADDAEREKALGQLGELRKIRQEQVTDARANNLATVTAELAKTAREAPKDEDSAESEIDISDIAMTCVETGVIAPAAMTSNWDGLQDITAKLEEDCMMSGRIPTENRCPARDVGFVCREAVDDKTERLTFFYNGTPEERSGREGCKGEAISAAQLQAAGAAFKNTAMRRILSCAPVPAGRGQD